jgi:hypothetical protein
MLLGLQSKVYFVSTVRSFLFLVSCFLFLPFIHNEVGVHSLDPESVGMITRLEGLSDYFTH